MAPKFWNEVPKDLQERYTMNNNIEMFNGYYDGTYHGAIALKNSDVQEAIHDIQMRTEQYERYMDSSRHEGYGDTTCLLLRALDKYPIQDKTVLNVGNSGDIWFESIILARGGIPTTADYNRLESDCVDLKFITDRELAESSLEFDCAFSISSFEHSGLGRYGDELNPEGDYEAMRELKKHVKPGGLLYLVVPIGKDCVTWNAHRIYGRIRLPLLMCEWEVVDRFGVNERYLDISNNGNPVCPQPVFILRNI